MIYVDFSHQINAVTSQAFMGFLAEKINSQEEEFYILFSSPGGTIIDGIKLFNFIKSLPANLTMHNIGMVDSVANIVFLAADKRYANPFSSFLFHGIGFNVSQPTRFEIKDVKERLTTIQRDQKLITDIILKRTKIKEEELEEMFLETKTKNPEDTKKLGLIQKIKEAKIPKGAKVFPFVLQQLKS